MNRFRKASMVVVLVTTIIFASIGQTSSQDPWERPKDVRGLNEAAVARDALRDAVIKAWLDAWPECVEDLERKVKDQPRCRVYMQKVEHAPTDFFIPSATAKKLTPEEIWWLKHNIGEAAKVGYYYGRERASRER